MRGYFLSVAPQSLNCVHLCVCVCSQTLKYCPAICNSIRIQIFIIRYTYRYTYIYIYIFIYMYHIYVYHASLQYVYMYINTILLYHMSSALFHTQFVDTHDLHIRTKRKT